MEGFGRTHLDKAFIWVEVGGGGQSGLEEGQSAGVCFQLVLIMGLMWRSDLKHTLTLQAQVKAGYGFWEAPFTAASVSQFPLS